MNERDDELGTMEKLEAHRRGVLHRAVSVLVFDRRGRLLLQRRASTKYHSPGRWANSCCSHPRPGERPADAAHRRLREEMGMACALHPAFAFRYEADVGAGLREHEYDHVFVGVCDDAPCPDAAEVAGWRYAEPAEIQDEISRSPERFAPWFPILVDHLVAAADGTPWSEVRSRT